MNLATLALTLYLRNPTERSAVTDAPLVVLPNGMRLSIEAREEEDYFYDEDGSDYAYSYEIWDVYREYDRYGYNRHLLQTCYRLEAITQLIAQLMLDKSAS